MAQSPSITTIPSSPPVDPDLRRTVSALLSSMRDGGLTEKLSVVVRTRLDARLDMLRSSVKQAAIDQIETAVAKLMAGYPSMRTAAPAEAALMVRQYAEALLGVPLWAIRDAARDIARGAIAGLNPDFPPTSARLRQLVDGYVTAIHAEALEIKEVLNAPQVLPDNPDVAARINLGFAQLTKTLHANIEAEKPAPKVPWKAPTPADIKAHYDSFNLGFQPKPRRNEDRNGTADDDVTFHDREGVR